MMTMRAAAAAAALMAAAMPGVAPAATYKLTPLKIKPAGEFVPVGISDTGVVPGTYYTGAGSTVGYAYTSFAGYLFNDFCGGAGAADQTADTAMSPYSTTEFIAGNCGNGQGFVYDLQTAITTPVAYPGPTLTTVNGVNGGGLVVGTYLDSNFVYHGYYLFGSEYIPFDPPGSYATFPAGINTNNVVYGMYQTSSATQSAADSGFTLDIYGHYTTIAVPGATQTGVNGLNGAGLAVGSFYAPGVEFGYEQAFAWTQGFFYTLPYANVLTAHVSAINENGVAAGYLQTTSGQTRGFVWKVATGSIITWPAPSSDIIYRVVGINNANQVTGWYFNSNTNRYVAFVGNCSGTGCF